MRATKKDLVFLLILILFCALLCIPVFSGTNAAGETVSVYRSGQLIASYPLDRDTVFTISDSVDLTVQIENGTVRVLHSACAGQDCVHMPPIANAGQSILCAPQQILLRITGSSGAPDAVVS